MTEASYLTDRNDLLPSDIASHLLDDFEEDCDRTLSFLKRIGNSDTDVYKETQKLAKRVENIYGYDNVFQELVSTVKLAKLDNLL